MKQMEVTILGQSYILACPDGGENALLEAVATVDREMSAIRDAGKVKARERMAVLAALNLAYQLAEAMSAAGSATRGAGTVAGAGGANDADGFDVDALIQRIDQALGNDGLLL